MVAQKGRWKGSNMSLEKKEKKEIPSQEKETKRLWKESGLGGKSCWNRLTFTESHTQAGGQSYETKERYR